MSYTEDANDPRPWYIVKMEREFEQELERQARQAESQFSDLRKELRALRWTLAAVAALAALAGNLLGALPT